MTVRSHIAIGRPIDNGLMGVGGATCEGVMQFQCCSGLTASRATLYTAPRPLRGAQLSQRDHAHDTLSVEILSYAARMYIISTCT